MGFFPIDFKKIVDSCHKVVYNGDSWNSLLIPCRNYLNIMNPPERANNHITERMLSHGTKAGRTNEGHRISEEIFLEHGVHVQAHMEICQKQIFFDDPRFGEIYGAAVRASHNSEIYSRRACLRAQSGCHSAIHSLLRCRRSGLQSDLAHNKQVRLGSEHENRSPRSHGSAHEMASHGLRQIRERKSPRSRGTFRLGGGASEFRRG